MDDLPNLALSVRQPWAWAIVHAGKDIENRTRGSIRAGEMKPGPICIHAASAMTKAEYEWAVWRMARDGVRVPRPDDLPRRAIIGTVEVVAIVERSTSPWFGGPCGLLLAGPRAIDPIPAAGARGYFEWRRTGRLAAPLAWMRRWDRANGDATTASLFPDDVSFRVPPEKPWSG